MTVKTVFLPGGVALAVGGACRRDLDGAVEEVEAMRDRAGGEAAVLLAVVV